MSIEEYVISLNMKTINKSRIFLVAILLCIFSLQAGSQSLKENPALDAKVKKYLSSRSRAWYDMNVPNSEGKLQYNIIMTNNYKTALEMNI